MKNVFFVLISLILMVFAGCSTQVDENPIKVESNDDLVSAQSGDVKANASFDDNGTIVVNSNIDTSSLDYIEMDSWCIVGNTYEYHVDSQTTVNFEIIGPEMFKDKLHCLSTGVLEIGEYEVNAAIYAESINADFWIVTDMFGKSVEQRVKINGSQ